ncbi:MAG: hypothetical protein ACXAEU_06515 [Candidatus Hodarchaeales archaeon]|jgi:hypothetical protein
MEKQESQQDEQLESYKKALEKLQDSMKSIVSIFSNETDFKRGMTTLSANYDLIANTLSTLLNWIRLQQEGLAAFGSVHDWSQALSEEDDISVIRYQLRTMINSQVETMTQNFVTSDRNSNNMLQFVTGQLDNIPRMINQTVKFNEKFLSVLQYNAIYETSLLSNAVNYLYQGKFKKFQETLADLNKNLEKL